MGAWGYDIYQNDIAMDLIARIYEEFCNGTEPTEILIYELNRVSKDEELLVLADFELFITGKVYLTDDVLKVLNNLIKEVDFENGEIYINRKNKLLKFKQKILDSKNATPINRTNKEIANWLEETRKKDII